MNTAAGRSLLKKKGKAGGKHEPCMGGTVWFAWSIRCVGAGVLSYVLLVPSVLPSKTQF